MKHVVEALLIALGGIGWLAGIVLASGAWFTAMAVCIPFYAWYLVVEMAMRKAGLL